jgi:hypothetical protein
MARRGDERFGMTPVAIAALGLDSEQADWIGRWGTNFVASTTEWAKASLQHGEPGEGVLFRYVIPPSSAEFNRMVESHQSVLADALGADRAKLVDELLLLDVQTVDARLAASGAELAVSRGSDGKVRYQILQATAVSKPYRETGEVSSPDQKMPVVFRMLFPGGWGQLLSSKGIVLSTEK